MIMKLHTLTPHESRMCPIDFGVKRSTVKVMAHGYLKMVHRNNGCRFEFVGVGGGPVLLQQYFQYALIVGDFLHMSEKLSHPLRFAQSDKRSLMITQEMCLNKGRNFNTQKFGKMYLFVICMISRHWFQTKLLLYIA